MTERTAEEWGRVAVSLPGWRWMPGMLSRCSTDTRRAVYRWLVGLDTRHYGLVCIVQDKHGRPCRKVATLQPGPDDLPDPDDPATEGWLVRLLGRQVTVRQRGQWVVEWKGMGRIGPGMGAVSRSVVGTGPSLGRACIAAAAALGRWPGGEG